MALAWDGPRLAQSGAITLSGLWRHQSVRDDPCPTHAPEYSAFSWWTGRGSRRLVLLVARARHSGRWPVAAGWPLFFAKSRGALPRADWLAGDGIGSFLFRLAATWAMGGAWGDRCCALADS